MEKTKAPRLKPQINFKSLFREWGLILFILVVIIVASTQRPAFLSAENLVNILRSYSTYGIAALGVAFTIIGGGMDLSIGSTVSLSAVVTMLIINATTVDRVSPAYATFIVLIVGILIGACVGAIAGGIIAAVNGRAGESMVLTYALQIIIAAVANGIVDGQFQAAAYRDGLFKTMGTGMIPVLFFLVLAVILQFVLAKTSFGRHLYFLGSNMQAAKMAGIRTRLVRFMAHVICGACAGLAGVLVVSRVNSSSITQGLNYEMDAMACVAIGGVSMNGGDGNLAKVVLGAIVLGVLLNALNLLGVQANPQLIVRGAVIILAVILDVWNKNAKLKEVAK